MRTPKPEKSRAPDKPRPVPPPGSPRAVFAALLRQHMDIGTRPAGIPIVGAWNVDDFARQIGVSKRQMEYYRDGSRLPRDLAPTLERLFGSDPKHTPARTAFIAAFDAARGAEAPALPLAETNITIRVPRHFLGRDDSLAAVHAALQRYEGRVAITALHGMRGVGKTVLAAAYAQRHRTAYRAAWWLPAATPDTLRASLVALGTRLAWLPPDMKEEEAVATTLARLRDDGEGILLIYDNAIDAKSLTPYLPQGDAARIIITSNNPAWGDLAEPVEIRLWPAAIGADFLIARTGRTTEREAAESLSETLGGLPLAHEMAAAFCEQTGTTLAAYAALFAATPLALLDDTPRAPGAYYDGTTVARAFTLAIEQATARHPAAALLLAHAALLAPEPIPVFLFAEGREHLGEPLASRLAGLGLEDALAALRSFALVTREAIPDERDPSLLTDSLRLHRLVREVAPARLLPAARTAAQAALLAALAATYPAGTYNTPATWPRARLLDPLATALVADVPLAAAPTLATLLDAMASFRQGHRAGYREALPLFQRALSLRETSLGPDHPDTATSLNNLAVLLQDQSNLAAARPLFERALAIRETAFGPEHLVTATSLNNLVLLLQVQGNLAAALPLSRRALAIFEARRGPDHHETATCLHYLARLHRDMGDLAAALTVHRRALPIFEATPGPNHPDTAASLHNLARLLQDMGDLDAALPLLCRALSINVTALGPDHSHTARVRRHLARLLLYRSDPTTACVEAERALAVHEAVLGPTHAWTLDSARTTAEAYDAINRPADATALRQRLNLPPP